MDQRSLAYTLAALALGGAACVRTASQRAATQAFVPGGTKACERAPGLAAAPLGVPAAGLAGGYRLTVVSRGPKYAGRSVTGVLWLWPTSGRDSSARTGRRAAPGDTAWHPLYGATDVQLWDLTR